jgi:hypothetical protein
MMSDAYYFNIFYIQFDTLIPLAVRSQGRSEAAWLPGFASSNLVEGLDLRLLCLLCDV